MRAYSHTGLGLGLLLVLVSVLLAALPSRLPLLFQLPSLLAISDPLMPLPGLTVKSTPPLREPAPPAAPQTPGSAPAVQTAPTPEPSRVQEPSKPGEFTLDFGPFATDADAEAVEKRLSRLGASTIRHRKRSASALYAVKLGEFQTPAEAKEAMERLRARHPALKPGKVEPEAEGRIRIVVERLFPLREAVALAAQLRTEGFAVRVETAPGAAPLFTLQLAGAYDLKIARAKSEEFRGYGVPNAVVPVEPAYPSAAR